MQSDRAVVVVTSGALRVDEARVSACIGEAVGKAGADFVRSHTGFAIGGVAPVGLPVEAVLLVDRSLLALDPVWAAAGTPSTVFRLASAALAALPGAQLASVSQSPGS
jgi:prolyl-tRNA editing enzyme YbaK/EbsC (Cys-tRNA(Pro) deacylase)